MADLQSFKQNVQALVRKFEQDKHHHLSTDYNEAQVRIDFLNPFFDVLGRDIENKAHKPPMNAPSSSSFPRKHPFVLITIFASTAAPNSSSRPRPLGAARRRDACYAGHDVHMLSERSFSLFYQGFNVPIFLTLSLSPILSIRLEVFV